MSKPFMCGDEVAVYVPEGGCDCNYTLQRVDDDTYEGVYKLMLNGSQVGDLVTVPKDRYVNAASIKTVDVAEVPYAGAKVGDAYLDMTFQNYSEHIYVSLASIMGGGYLIVDELPETGDSRYIYLVDDGQGNYDRYVWDSESEDWVNIGGTSIDLSNYYTKSEIDGMIANIMLRIYPIGSIYTSIDDTDPGTLFGGTWTRLTDTFLYAVPSGQSDQSATTKTAGSENHNHGGYDGNVTLGINHIPAHTHGMKQLIGTFGHTLYTGGQTHASTGIVDSNLSSKRMYEQNGTSTNGWFSYGINASHEHSSVGGGQAHRHPILSADNMPPYMKVYMWKRTA